MFSLFCETIYIRTTSHASFTTLPFQSDHAWQWPHGFNKLSRLDTLPRRMSIRDVGNRLWDGAGTPYTTSQVYTLSVVAEGGVYADCDSCVWACQAPSNPSSSATLDVLGTSVLMADEEDPLCLGYDLG